MNVRVLFSVLCIFHMASALVLDYDKVGLHPKAKVSIQKLRNVKKTLESQLQSIMTSERLTSGLMVHKETEPKRAHGVFSQYKGTKKLDNSSEQEETLYLLPNNLLRPDIFKKLGLGYLSDESSFFNLTYDFQNIMIPKDTKSLFIFNTTKPLSFAKDKTNNFAEFLGSSAPFNLPDYTSLINHYAVIPKSYLRSHFNLSKLINPGSVYYNSVLEVPVAKVPIFRNYITENKPVMVFLFNDGVEDNSSQMGTEEATIMNFKNYLPQSKTSHMISSFFDSFANNWIGQVNYDSLIHSIFCTTNVQSLDDSYCLKIHDKDAIHLFPAFFDVSRFIDPESKKLGSNNLDGTIPSSPLNNEVNLEKLTNNVSPTTTLQSDVDGKHLSSSITSKSSLTDASKLSPVASSSHNAAATDDEKAFTETLVPLLSIAQSPSSQALLMSLPSTTYHPEMEYRQEEADGSTLMPDHSTKGLAQVDDIHPTDLSLLGNYENTISLKDAKSNSTIDMKLKNLFLSLLKRSFEEDEIHLLNRKPDGGLILPVSLIKELKETDFVSPRKKTYAQVVYNNEPQRKVIRKYADEFTSKRTAAFSDDENCEKITWYNIFHYSIFGKPNFCLD